MVLLAAGHGGLGLAGADLGLAAFFLVGLLGGAHCLGMCGPLVSVYARHMDDSDRLTVGEVRQHTLFNLGRTAGYAAVGGLMGLLGAVVFDAAALLALTGPVRGVVGVLAGLVVVGAGVTYLTGGSVGHQVPVAGDLFARVSAAATEHVETWASGPRVVGLGLLHAAMPCPLLYPAYLAAVATGDPVTGALSLGVLGLGTIPAVFLVGTAMGRVSARARTRLHRALGAAFVLLGAIPLLHGLGVLGLPVPHVRLPMPNVTTSVGTVIAGVIPP